ncbi:MAG: ComF family protein, partial [Clostridia bacterium]|nr:ComF family protein [Clostridia bacterium]
CIGVPRSPKNIRKYGYDHAKKLAKRLSEILEIDYADALFHKGGTVEQKKLDNLEKRRQNARNNCIIKEKQISKICGKKILLIDDIGTTGSMATACADLLKKHGALRVDCVLCARNQK